MKKEEYTYSKRLLSKLNSFMLKYEQKVSTSSLFTLSSNVVQLEIALTKVRLYKHGEKAQGSRMLALNNVTLVVSKN